jgi:hypothetical protein
MTEAGMEMANFFDNIFSPSLGIPILEYHFRMICQQENARIFHLFF